MKATNYEKNANDYAMNADDYIDDYIENMEDYARLMKDGDWKMAIWIWTIMQGIQIPCIQNPDKYSELPTTLKG